MESTTFAGFTWPKQEWSLPKGKPSSRVCKPRSSGYYQNSPCMAGEGEIGFYWGEGGEESGRLWTLRAKTMRMGWYCNNFQDESITGFAFRLPRGRGFLAGWMMGDQMCASVSRRIYDDENGALQAGHRMAELAAERMREEDAKDQAEQQIQEAREEILDIREQVQIALRDRHASSAPESLCRMLRSWVAERLDEIRSKRVRIALLERDPWKAVSW